MKADEPLELLWGHLLFLTAVPTVGTAKSSRFSFCSGSTVETANFPGKLYAVVLLIKGKMIYFFTTARNIAFYH
ncbi:MAG: hypothetical protein RR336_02295, partial [Oscillospiraceae bacterium]